MNGGLFLLAWILCVSSWFLAIIEMFSVRSFSRVFFKIGIPICRQSININTEDLNIEYDEIIKKSEGRFKFTADHKVYFLSQRFWFKFFNLRTPFPFKTIGSITPNKIELVARVPLGTSLFLLFWLIGWSGGNIATSYNAGSKTEISLGALGWVIAALIAFISYKVEMSRFKKMIKELKEIIKTHSKREIINNHTF